MQMTEALQTMAIKYPGSFGMWACIMTDFFYGINEIAIVGNNYDKITFSVLKYYMPNKIVQSSPGNSERFPLLSNRLKEGRTLIYVCREYSCLNPVESAAECVQLIERKHGG